MSKHIRLKSYLIFLFFANLIWSSFLPIFHSSKWFHVFSVGDNKEKPVIRPLAFSDFFLLILFPRNRYNGPFVFIKNEVLDLFRMKYFNKRFNRCFVFITFTDGNY